MKTIIIFVLAALAALAQSVPPGGGKPLQVSVDGADYTASPKINFVPGSGMGAYSKSSANGITTITFNASGGAGTGDMIAPGGATVDGELVQWSGTGGYTTKRFSGSGLVIATNGVASVDSGLQWSNSTKGIGVFGPITSGQTSNYQGKLYLNGLTSGTWGLTADADGSGASTTGKITATGGFYGAVTGNVTGNVSGTSGSTTGNAATATALATARTIFGTSFDGTGNIGSRTGNTSELASWTGTKTTGKQLGIDANGNIYASASDIGGSGTGADALGYYLVNRATNAPANAVNLGLLTTSLLKITVAGAVATPSSAAYGDVVALWTTCSAGYLKYDGTCSTPSGSMVYPGAGIALSTGSGWGTSLTAPTGSLVGAGQANTFTTGAQDFGSATSLKVPTSAGAAPTANGLIAYDSTANAYKGGVNGAAYTILAANASGNTTLPGTLTIPGTGASNLTAIAAPGATPAAGTADIYIDSTAKTFFVKDDAGAYSHTVKTKAAVSNQFLTAVNDAGTFSSAAIAAADLPSTLTSGTAITNASLTTPSIGAATGTSLVATGIVSGLAPVTYLQDADPCPTGTHCAVGATYNMGYIINGATTEASATFFDLPAAVAGMQYCFENGAGNSAATTGVMKVIAASGDYITLLGVKSGTSGTTATSGGAAGDAACFIAVKADEWVMKTSGGTWTTN